MRKRGALLVEVLFGQDLGTEEGHKRDDGDNAHVADPLLEVLLNTPKADGEECDHSDKEVSTVEFVTVRLDGRYGKVRLPAVPDVKEGPDL